MKALRSLAERFWAVYHRHYTLVLAVTTVSLLLQLLHLYWLFTDVVLRQLVGHSFFFFPESGTFFYAFIDYIEIPTLLSATLLYVFELRQRFTARGLLLLVLLNTHWLHLLWITDDVVVQRLTGESLVVWPALAAWVAIAVDYLEVPVIVDRLRALYAEREQLAPAMTALIPRWFSRLAYAALAAWR